MAKYAFPIPYDYYCRNCESQFYTKDLIKTSFPSRLNLGKGCCPKCKRAHDVFPIIRDDEQ